jgi:hypothetical protein
VAQNRVGEAVLRQPWLPRLRRTVRIAGADDASTRAVWAASIGSRALVWLAGLTTIALFGRNTSAAFLDPQGLTAPFRASWLNSLFAPTARWDSAWYLQIAHDGYFSRSSSAFFPLYPLLIHLGAGVFGSPLIVGVAISVVSMGIAIYYLERLARLDLGEHAARTTILLIAFFPTALFLSAVYTESLFLALSVGSVYAARLNRWSVAGLLGALAAAARPNGVLIVLPLIVLYFYGPRTFAAKGAIKAWLLPDSRPLRSLVWLLLVPVGLIAYMVYLWITHDAPLAPFQVQAAWGRQFAGPLGAVGKLLTLLPHDVHVVLHGGAHRVTIGDAISWPAHDLIDLGFLAFAGLGLAFSWRRLPMAYTVYALAMVAESLSSPDINEPLASFPRYILVVFPLFMGWAAELGENRRASRALLIASAAGLVVFTGLFAYWDWVA